LHYAPMSVLVVPVPAGAAPHSIPAEDAARGLTTEGEAVEHSRPADGICQAAERFAGQRPMPGHPSTFGLVGSDAGFGDPGGDETRPAALVHRAPAAPI